MNRQTLQLIQMMLDPRITAKPVWSMAKLRARGIQRIPEDVLNDLKTKGNKGHALSFIKKWLDGEMFTRIQSQWVLNSFIPPFPGPAYDRMFENLFSGRHLSPVSAFIAITSSCSLQCTHCSARRDIKADLSTAKLIGILDELKDLGTSIVGITGGEPLERDDLPELIEACKKRGLATILFTSGIHCTPEKVQMLKKSGLWSCCVSLDFDNADEHDRMRGKEGVFHQALETIKQSRAAGFYTMVSSVASRSFTENRAFEKIYSMCKELGVHEYRLVEPMPCGALANANDDMLLTDEHIRVLRNFHVETNRKQKHPKICAFNQIESPEIFGCGAGTQHLYIQADGMVCPCDFTPLSFGKVQEQPLADIWKRMNLAMGDNPRSHCFIQKHHQLINSYQNDGFPLPPEISEAICREAGTEPMPGYFAMVTGKHQ